MGNGQFEVPRNLQQEWSQFFQDRQRVLWNRITCESFDFIVLAELKSDLHISHLIERSIYPLPRTPKIIILNDKAGEISILAQRRAMSLKALLAQARLELQLFKIIREIVGTLESLFRRFGPFGVNQRMVGGNSNAEVLAWINETPELCQIQLELPKNDQPEMAMLEQTIALIRSNSTFELFHDVFTAPPNSFAEFMAKITEMIEVERESLAMQRVPVSNRRIDPPYPIKPRKTGNSPSLVRVNEKDDEVVKRRGNIPKFLKKNKMFPEQGADWKESRIPCEKRHIYKDSFREDSEKSKQKSLCKYSVGKVRSLSPSPSAKHHSKYTNSFATTNYSLLSHHHYRLTPDTIEISKVSSSKQFKSGTADGGEYKIKVHEVEARKDGGFQPFPSKNYQNTQPKNYSLKGNFKEVAFEQQRTGYSYGSLNFHCKFLSDYKELAVSRADEQTGPTEAGREIFVSGESQANGGNFSMVIHNELESIFGVEEEETVLELDIHEEFSRIIY